MGISMSFYHKNRGQGLSNRSGRLNARPGRTSLFFRRLTSRMVTGKLIE